MGLKVADIRHHFYGLGPSQLLLRPEALFPVPQKPHVETSNHSCRDSGVLTSHVLLLCYKTSGSVLIKVTPSDDRHRRQSYMARGAG